MAFIFATRNAQLIVIILVIVVLRGWDKDQTRNTKRPTALGGFSPQAGLTKRLGCDNINFIVTKLLT
jgi:hypothetical protein